MALLTCLSVAGGCLVANVYYAQPLIGLIGPEFGVPSALVGSIVSAVQVGYGAGLFLLVPVSDLVENRRLIISMMLAASAALCCVALSNSLPAFILALVAVGLCSTAAQVILPMISHLVSPDKRGRVVGNVMAGVLTGIMLARPISSFIAASFGWRAVFWFSAVLVVTMAAVVFCILPVRRPAGRLSYGSILRSMGGLLRSSRTLRRRSAFQALMFCAFNVFWTASPLVLAEHFRQDQRGIGLFALAGAGGALAAPIAGRLADAGWTRTLTLGSTIAATATFVATLAAVSSKLLLLFAFLALTLDAAAQALQIVNQRIVFAGATETRGRSNAVFATLNFVGGSIGSFIATIAYHEGDWPLTVAVGTLLGLAMLALCYFGGSD